MQSEVLRGSGVYSCSWGLWTTVGTSYFRYFPCLVSDVLCRVLQASQR